MLQIHPQEAAMPNYKRRGWFEFTGYTCWYFGGPRFELVDLRSANRDFIPREQLELGTITPTLEEYFKTHHGRPCDPTKVRVEVRISRLRLTPEEEHEFRERADQLQEEERRKRDSSPPFQGLHALREALRQGRQE